MTPPSAPRFVTVLVEEHPELPDGCCMRFKLVGDPHPVRRVRYESDLAPDIDVWVVEAASAERSPVGAWAATVEDSGAGTCILVYGGTHGLRLRPPDGGPTVAEPYLLLAPDALVE